MKHVRVRMGHNKAKVKGWALKTGRKVLWLDSRGRWHAATDRYNTPNDAIETEDIK